MKLNKDNFVIGVTGGIGCGKTQILNILENEYGAEIIIEDKVAKGVSKYDSPVGQKLREAFGDIYILPEAILDNKKLSEMVFNDLDKLDLLGKIIHPEVRKRVRDMIMNKKGLIVIEAALPVQGGFKEFCDEIWYVHTDLEIRIDRLLKYRGYSREKTLDIMDCQLKEEEFRALADRVIDNNGTLEDVRSQIAEAMKNIQKG